MARPWLGHGHVSSLNVTAGAWARFATRPSADFTPPLPGARPAAAGRGNAAGSPRAIAVMLARVMSSGSVPNWVLVSDVLKPARSWYSASFSRTVLGLPTMTTPFLTRSSIDLRLAGDLGGAHALHRFDVGVARRQQHLGRHLQEAVDQRFEMRPRLAHRLLVGLGDIDGVRPGELVGRGLVARLLGLVAVHLEEARHRRDRAQRLAVGVAHRAPPSGWCSRSLARESRSADAALWYGRGHGFT